jgi:predicted small metal-binding protein
MKVLRCREMGFDCNEEIRAESEEELLRKAAEHATSQHGLQLTPDMVTQVKSHIHDEQSSKDAPRR